MKNDYVKPIVELSAISLSRFLCLSEDAIEGLDTGKNMVGARKLYV